MSAGRLDYADPIGLIAVDHLPRMILTAAPVLDSVTHLRAPQTVIFDDRVLVHDETFDPTGL